MTAPLSRRKFLTTGAAIGCSAAASPLLTPVTFAQTPTDNRLVVIILRGAMDGIDAVRPTFDAAYASARPTLAGGDGAALAGGWQLHPALAPLKPLWDAGECGAVHAVSTPYRNKRSHFDGQDILEAGLPEIGGGSSGWLNRMLQAMPGAEADLAYAVGTGPMAILSGAAPTARWAPNTRLRLSPQAKRLLELVHHDDDLFRAASTQAIAIAEQLESDALADPAGAADAADDSGSDDMMMSPAMQAVAKARGAHLDIARFTASRLRGASRIASFSINGWDTHRNQHNTLRRALRQLSETILTLRAELGPVWDRTAVLCLTEFGRTVRENGTRGTDHGTGGAVIYAGGALRGGQVLGHWPGMAEEDLLARRDLRPTGDVRAVAGWAMRGLFGLDRAVIEDAIFPGLDLGGDPGFVA